MRRGPAVYVGSLIVALLLGAAAMYWFGFSAGIVVLGIWALGFAMSVTGRTNTPLMLGRAAAGAGSLIAIFSVVQALNGEAGAPPYSERMWLGVTAAVLAVVAGAAPWISSLPRWAQALLVFPVGFVGFIGTMLWYINSYYFAALPFWLLATVLLFAAPAAVRREPLRSGS